MTEGSIRALTGCIALLALLGAVSGDAAERVVLCEEFSNVF